MSITALRLSDFAVKMARNHPAIKGKNPIARGCYSAVFEGSKPNTVFKLTIDNFGYWMLNCYAARVRHHLFPKAVQSFGMVGETKINGEKYPIHLFEMEKLNKLERSGEARKQAMAIATTRNKSSLNTGKIQIGDIPYFTLLEMAKNTSLSRMVRNALGELATFCSNYPGGKLDMHMGNFMQRKNGSLVITDPLMDLNVFDARTKELQQRGY
jgi:hypothetical protein